MNYNFIITIFSIFFIVILIGINLDKKSYENFYLKNMEHFESKPFDNILTVNENGNKYPSPHSGHPGNIQLFSAILKNLHHNLTYY